MNNQQIIYISGKLAPATAEGILLDSFAVNNGYILILNRDALNSLLSIYEDRDLTATIYIIDEDKTYLCKNNILTPDPELNNLILKGNSFPTSNVSIGTLFINSVNGNVYRCVGIEDDSDDSDISYKWTQFQSQIDINNKLSADFIQDGTTNKAFTAAERTLIETNTQAINTIEEKIPEEASSSNKLVDKAAMQSFALPITTKYGANLSLEFNSANGKLKALLKNQDGNNIGSEQEVTIDLQSIENTINGILDLIPAQATAQNKLADKEFVNSSISTSTANFIGTFENLVALKAYSGTVTNNDYANVMNSVVTNNGADFISKSELDAYPTTNITNFDYAWVINGSKFDLYRYNLIDQIWELRVEHTDKNQVTLNTAYNRYKANVIESIINWHFDFTVNATTFTAVQWAAINSGITASLVDKLVGIESGAQVNAPNTVIDANYKHITVTGTSVSDGTNTFNKYVLPNDVVQDSSYVHTDNNFTNADKTKLDNTATNIKNGQGVASLISNDDANSVNNYARGKAAIAFGSGNYADGNKAIALGTQNNVSFYAKLNQKPTYSEAVSSGNCYYFNNNDYIKIDNTLSENDYNSIENIFQYNSILANSSIGVGQLNIVYGNCGGAFGSTNTLDINGGNSFVFGKENYLSAYRSFVAGSRNITSNGNKNIFLLGMGLSATADDKVIVGIGNNEVQDAIFEVGAGKYNSNNEITERKTPFYVKPDGAYTNEGKLTSNINIKDGSAVGSIVGLHVGNPNANTATGVGSLAGGSAGFWQGDGQNTNVSGQGYIGWGFKTNVKGNWSIGVGWGLDVDKDIKAVFGYYNLSKTDTYLEIGNGANASNRSNAFEVYKNGTVRAYGTPTDSNDLISKGYADNHYQLIHTQVTDLTHTTQTLTLTANTRYALGILTALSLTFPVTGNDGDEIIIEFVSGSTATTLILDNVNAIYNFSSINADKFVELNAQYKVSIDKWVVYSAETDYTVV